MFGEVICEIVTRVKSQSDKSAFLHLAAHPQERMAQEELWDTHVMYLRKESPIQSSSKEQHRLRQGSGYFSICRCWASDGSI